MSNSKDCGYLMKECTSLSSSWQLPSCILRLPLRFSPIPPLNKTTDVGAWRCQLLSLPPAENSWSSQFFSWKCTATSYPLPPPLPISQCRWLLNQKKWQRTKLLPTSFPQLHTLSSPFLTTSHTKQCNRGSRENGKQKTKVWGSTMGFKKGWEWRTERRVQEGSWARLTLHRIVTATPPPPLCKVHRMHSSVSFHLSQIRDRTSRSTD